MITEIRFDAETGRWQACNEAGPVMTSKRKTNLTRRYPDAVVKEPKP